MDSPDDVSGLKELIDSGQLNPEEVVAILGKTEGNGCVNDFTRGFCTASFSSLMAEYLNVDTKEVEKKIAFVMSGGTEGVMTPHATVFTSREVAQQEVSEKRLAIGVSMTRDFAPEEIGTMVQVTAPPLCATRHQSARRNRCGVRSQCRRRFDRKALG
ncbi:ring-opening amidohydrolase [Aminobacter sp. SR38]|uniref:ring-opening amidohydrolase n=1 Tax=Aminobacter sp. SR38 TaxID=2774562 RepID=UPI001FEE7042|nr:ring-opening amidohydrolase [Aminobacter sp. SR38]